LVDAVNQHAAAIRSQRNQHLATSATLDFEFQRIANYTVPPRRSAYSFLVAGCDPNQPKYQGYLLNIFISIYHLWRSGSTTEIVIMVQMQPDQLPRVVQLRHCYFFEIREQNCGPLSVFAQTQGG
jgi:hypothetical protein